MARSKKGKRTFQPNTSRRAKRHGFLVRMRTRGGRAVIRARRAKGRTPVVKILGTGEITKALIVDACTVSAAARTALLAAHGTIHA